MYLLLKLITSKMAENIYLVPYVSLQDVEDVVSGNWNSLS